MRPQPAASSSGAVSVISHEALPHPLFGIPGLDGEVRTTQKAHEELFPWPRPRVAVQKKLRQFGAQVFVEAFISAATGYS